MRSLTLWEAGQRRSSLRGRMDHFEFCWEKWCDFRGLHECWSRPCCWGHIFRVMSCCEEQVLPAQFLSAFLEHAPLCVQTHTYGRTACTSPPRPSRMCTPVREGITVHSLLHNCSPAPCVFCIAPYSLGFSQVNNPFYLLGIISG